MNLPEILSKLKIEKLNPMQEQALEIIPKTENTLLLSPTGSGKTLAFLLPLLKILSKEKNGVQSLVIVPSRELAIQIENVWKQIGTGFKVNICYGGHSFEIESNNLKNPPALLIGTPGRLLDHVKQKSFNPKDVEVLILDEFDKSLQLKFHEEMEEIILSLENLKKRILISATHDIEIPEFTGVTSPKTIEYSADYISEGKQKIYKIRSAERDKLGSLFRLVCALHSESCIIFCNHREEVLKISDMFKRKGVIHQYYHGGMLQPDREKALLQFANKSSRILISTDLAARGLDIPEVNHVIHYHLPLKESEFTHRNGRTARMFASGNVYVLLSADEYIREYVPQDIKEFKLPKTTELPKEPEFTTLYISGGKKNKISKVDIVGFFTQKGKLDKDSVGKIDVKDFMSFVAVKTNKVNFLLNNISTEKMKGKKYKIEEVKEIPRFE